MNDSDKKTSKEGRYSKREWRAELYERQRQEDKQRREIQSNREGGEQSCMNDSAKTRTRGETVEERGGEQSCMNDSDKTKTKGDTVEERGGDTVEGRDSRRERG